MGKAQRYSIEDLLQREGRTISEAWRYPYKYRFMNGLAGWIPNMFADPYTAPGTTVILYNCAERPLVVEE